MTLITVHCEQEDCIYNGDGECYADMGILIDDMGSCATYEGKGDDE